MKLHQRTLDQIDASGDCWVWTGPTKSHGYGPYRRVWNALVGPVPAGLQLDHLCRNILCVNPDHLEPVTPAENNRRAFSFATFNRRKTHCVNGHEFTPENTYMRPGRYGRTCRTCQYRSVRTYQGRAWVA